MQFRSNPIELTVELTRVCLDKDEKVDIPLDVLFGGQVFICMALM